MILSGIKANLLIKKAESVFMTKHAGI
jgi:hypothetical protein